RWRIGEGFGREPVFAGPLVPDDLDRSYNVRSLCVARCIQGGGRRAEIHGQATLPGPQSVELPSTEQRARYTVRTEMLSLAEWEIVDRTVRKNVAAVIPRETLVVLVAQLVVSAVVDRLSECIRCGHHEAVSKTAIEFDLHRVV